MSGCTPPCLQQAGKDENGVPDDGRRTVDDRGVLVVHRPWSIVHFQSSHHERLLATLPAAGRQG
jgi:hypothetical protein